MTPVAACMVTTAIPGTSTTRMTPVAGCISPARRRPLHGHHRDPGQLGHFDGWPLGTADNNKTTRSRPD